ncbi:MAG: HNH endonuclease, partial [Candidatus Saccharibacteria bacterium]|nr:HNH endonuclease [Microbacteriaceae bacterium]
MDPALTIEAMRVAAVAMRSGVGPCTARAIQTAQDALDAVKAECLGDMAQTRSYETDGASSLGMWAGNELCLGANDASAW